MKIGEFLLARITEDETAARDCAEVFPPPWEIADRGWRVRIYASDVPIPDLCSDDEDAMTTRCPVLMEVEPDRRLEDPRWLADRVEHVRRHDPARVLAECEAKRREIARHPCDNCGMGDDPCETLRLMTLPYTDHEDYDPAWRP